MTVVGGDDDDDDDDDDTVCVRRLSRSLSVCPSFVSLAYLEIAVLVHQNVAWFLMDKK
jgi:hypothetical protein